MSNTMTQIIKLTPEVQENAKNEIDVIFARLLVPDLSKTVKVLWRQMYRDVGASEWTIHKADNSISSLQILLSAKLWPYMSEKQRYDTLVHEVCHIVDVFQGNVYGDPHGPSWAKLMRKMGVTPKPSLRQLNVPYETLYEILPRCSLCRNVGHNRLYCPQKNLDNFLTQDFTIHT